MNSQGWEKEEIFDDGDRFFNQLIRSLKKAEKTIDLESYIFERDQLGFAILSSLIEAANRGVRVRLLLDGIGCSQWNYSHLSELRKAGVHTKVFHPLPWQVSSRRLFGSLNLKKLGKRFGLLNRRNHRKVCTIDGKIAFLGGMNISAHYLRKYSGQAAWQDISVCIAGHEIAVVAEAFERSWNLKYRFRHPYFLGFKQKALSWVRLNTTQRLRKLIHRDLIARIHQSKKRIWIITPYLVPRLSLINTLVLAAQRGVEIKVLVPRKNDPWFMQLMNHAFYPFLLKHSIEIYEYLPSFLHAKVILIDDWATVGSSNLNYRSFIHDLEIDVVLKLPSSVQYLQDRFLKYCSDSQKITLASWKKTPWITKIAESILRLFKYWT